MAMKPKISMRDILISEAFTVNCMRKQLVVPARKYEKNLKVLTRERGS